MLAHIAHEEPAAVLAVLRELLNELDVAPVNSVELTRVVVAIAAQSVDAAVSARELVPLLACNLARLAADANGRVSVKPHGLSHKVPLSYPSSRVRVSCS